MGFSNAGKPRRRARRAGCRTKSRPGKVSGALQPAATARRPHIRCLRERWPEWRRSRPDHFRRADVADPEPGDEIIAQIGGGAVWAEVLDVLRLNADFPAHEVFGGRPRGCAGCSVEDLS